MSDEPQRIVSERPAELLSCEQVHRLNSEMLHVCTALGFAGKSDPDDSDFVLFQAEPASL